MNQSINWPFDSQTTASNKGTKQEEGEEGTDARHCDAPLPPVSAAPLN